MPNLLNLNCRDATALMSQAQERKLSLGERLALRVHVLICSGCSNCRRQMNVLRDAARRFGRGDTP